MVDSDGSVATSVPEGFVPLETQSPFITLVGPLQVNLQPQGVLIGLRVATKHCNTSGQLHGGMLSTLADIALGQNIGRALYMRQQQKTQAEIRSSGVSMATVSLSSDFTGTASVGDWVEVQVDVHKAGRNLAFANAYVHCDELRIGRVSGVFRIFAQVD